MRITEHISNGTFASWVYFLLGIATYLNACNLAPEPAASSEPVATVTSAVVYYPPETVTFDVSFPEGSPGAAGIALAARDSLLLGPRDRISAACASGGDTVVGPASAIGDVTAVGRIDVEPAASTHNLTAGGDIILDPGATSTSVHAHASVTAPSLLHATVAIPAATADIRVPPGASLSLPPGSYGEVVVQPGARLTLVAGEYDLRALEVSPLAEIVVAGAAPVRVYVVNELNFAGEVSDGGDATRLRVIYLGAKPAWLLRAFRGTLIAPQASMELGPGHSTGFFYAVKLVAGPDAWIDAIPSPLTGIAPPISASGVTLNETQGIPFSATVALVTDGNASDTASSLAAGIDWGDGATTSGTVTGSGGAFAVAGAHTYAGSGSFSATVTVTSLLTGAKATATTTVFVVPELAVSAQSFSATQGLPFSGVIAAVADVNPAITASNLSATIAWGDGTTSSGAVTGAASPFQVSGQHTYLASYGTFVVTVTVTDTSDGVSAHASAAANVAPQIHIGGGTVDFSSLQAGYDVIWNDVNHSDVAADFQLTINWGDGSPTEPMGNTFMPAPGLFESLTPNHTYPAPGAYTISFTVTRISDGATWSGSDSANVAAEFTVSGVTFGATAGTPFTGTVANGTTTISIGDMAASIAWGDGTTTSGTLSGGGGTYSVTGSHTYASAGSYAVTVSVVDALLGAPTLTASSSAQVTP